MSTTAMRRRAAPTAADRDERYRQLVELAPDGILVHDGERVLLANASALRLAGATSRAEVVGQPIDRFLDPPHLKAVQAQITAEVSSLEQTPTVRDRFHRIDGSDVEVGLRAVVFLDNGRPAVHLVIRDVTERLAMERAGREAEHRLRQAERMEAVGALAGGVAHEVNNMMQVILGFSDFLLGDDRMPPECQGDVGEIITAAERAAVVTQQLLAFSRRAVYRPQAIDLAAAVRSAEPAVLRLLSEGQRLVLSAEVAPTVWVDASQLQQVIINLVLNARDAMPAGGTLTLKIGQTERPLALAEANPSVIPPGRYATLVVQDSGIGMDEATRARIFEPFFTTKPLGQGTGLGLSAVHGILAQNGCFITLATAPGKGTAFTIYLPLQSAAVRSEPRVERSRPSAALAPRGATILVVDDEPSVRKITARVLERDGYSVLTASGGAEALALVERLGPPQLLLTDLMMSGIGGLDLARRLHERWPALPVMLMSGYSKEVLLRRGGIGAEDELIEKPFSLVDLVAGVGVALARAAESSAPRVSPVA